MMMKKKRNNYLGKVYDLVLAKLEISKWWDLMTYLVEIFTIYYIYTTARFFGNPCAISSVHTGFPTFCLLIVVEGHSQPVNTVV